MILILLQAAPIMAFARGENAEYHRIYPNALKSSRKVQTEVGVSFDNVRRATPTPIVGYR